MSAHETTATAEVAAMPSHRRQHRMRIARRQHEVAVVVDEQRAAVLSTPAAARLVLEIGRALRSMAPGDCVRLVIDGEGFALTDAEARAVAAGLLRKADAADDWQRGIRAEGETTT